MDILDFILSNWWILIPIIWFFSGAFGNKGKKQEERNRNPHPVAQPIEVEESRNDAASVEFPWERVEQGRSKPSPQRNEYQDQQADVKPAANIRAQTPPLDVAAQDLTSRPINSLSDVRYSQEAKKRLDFKTIGTTSVVQGMVWSQVFGKPRSKEAHHTSMYTRFRRKA